MAFLSGFVLMSLAAQTPADASPVSLRYRRPSLVVAQAAGMKARFVADDARSVVLVSGTPAQVADAKAFLRLVDVPRKPLRLRVTVDSAADHLSWTVDATLVSGQRWKTSDDETGSEIVLDPRLDAAGRLQVSMIARSRGTELRSTLRLAKGQSRTVELGSALVQRYDVDVEAQKVKLDESGIALPKITLRYIGN